MSLGMGAGPVGRGPQPLQPSLHPVIYSEGFTSDRVHMLEVIKNCKEKKKKTKKTRTLCVAFRLFITGLQAWPR